MKRDALDSAACDIHAPQRTAPLPASELLVQQAHALWLASLTANGNQPSLDHRDAGWQLLRAMVDQLYGVSIGRYAYALPCGAGKTQAVVALLAAMFSLQAFRSGKTVLVVAQQVNALCEIKHKLLDAGLPELAVGIVHSKAGAALPSTGDHKRPIMLATHARIQQDGSLPECSRNRDGRIHDLVIWDEALISTEAMTLPVGTTVAALRFFGESGKCPTVALAHHRLAAAVASEAAAQKGGRPASELTPLVSEREADNIQRELNAVGYLDDTGIALRERALLGASLVQNAISLVDPRNGNSAELMRYVVKVPDGLTNIVILDASHAIDELRQADRTIRRGTSEAMTRFKDFGNVTAIHYPVASGRGTIKSDGKAIAEAVRIVKGLPLDEAVLLVTFKNWHEERLKKELQDCGVSVGSGNADDEPRRCVITWGRHTSDNSFTHCKHVVLVGLHRLPRVALASQLAALTRDLTHRRDKTGLLSLEQSVIAGEVMQAMNRGCMRLTDEQGKAHPMTVHILAKDDLRQPLERAMPGLSWKTVALKEPSRTTDATQRIVEFMIALPAERHSISKQCLFTNCAIVLGKDAKALALSEAMKHLAGRAVREPQHLWGVNGRSLVRKRLE